MKLSDFKLFICAIVFLFLNIILFLIYTQVIQKAPKIEKNVDVIFVARGRDRASIQHKIWLKYWEPLKNTRFLVLHLQGVSGDDQDDVTSSGLIHIQTTYTTEQDMFLHIETIVPNDQQRSPYFVWASDQIVPLRKVVAGNFFRNIMGSRFFSGFEPDAVLFDIEDMFEPTIPCGAMSYQQKIFDNYDQYLVYFISSKHNLYSHEAQAVVFPNPKNKAKRLGRTDNYQIMHITPSAPNQAELNDIVKQIWASYV